MSERSPGARSGALALGLVCALLAALPAAARVWQPGNGVLAALALWGAGSLVVVPVGGWLRGVRNNGLGGTDRALLAGTALSALPLALFGGVLKSTTHHRPLGGATFAVAALCVLALCVGLSFRFLGGLSRDAAKSFWQNLFTLGCGLSLACALLLGGSRATRPSLVDFLALAAAVLAASVIKIPSWLGRLSVPVAVAGWAVLLGGAVVALQGAPLPLVRSLTTQAPVLFAPLSWLGVGS
ncbi:MAG TPA: hypothetical protein VHP33_39330 [Polyangiaceae bacterium]|nr:hypothetical protein [Polyangiaceae bacterium]